MPVFLSYPLILLGFCALVTDTTQAIFARLVTDPLQGDLPMGSFIQNERKICGGRVMIYQRTDVKNSIWNCRISFQKQPIIRHSLGTTDEKEAEQAAKKLYEDYNMPIGLTHTPTRYSIFQK
ncbi:MAG: hypothetical protein WCF85_19215, partial [Rhodospirillaceae bacterium]